MEGVIAFRKTEKGNKKDEPKVSLKLRQLDLTKAEGWPGIRGRRGLPRKKH